MKRLFSFIFAAIAAVSAFAQTPEEVLKQMETVMNQHEKDGIIMTVEIKIPILGTISSKTYAKDNRFRLEAKTMGVGVTTWSDGTTSWVYDSSKNEVTIENEKPSSSSDAGDAEMFTGIADGYDVSFEKQTDQAWYIICKKSKTNTNKDDPKTMHVVVSKANYYPISLSAKMSGVTLTMRDLSFGVSDDQVIFDPAKYPGANIIDNR